ncbi:MAG: DUF4105 domain-containing protein [Saprospiraceae bacterium]|nr:DUF4105 domain-containing protein [Saprospiraceae bacterium]
MKHLFATFILWLVAHGSFAQSQMTLTDSSRISLMTVAPGDMIYSTFGHSAIRVKDPNLRFDRCYNYGTFDFEQPGFVLKFCRGKLLYMLDMEPYRSFEYGNLQDLRVMQEQSLNLSLEQKQRLFDLIQENYKEENRYYKYDFFYDNCATRIRDIFEETFFHQLTYDTSKLVQGVTMRQLLQPYVAEKPWLDFGIDLILGLPADRKAKAADFMFLPDYLHDLTARAIKPGGELLVSGEQKIPANGIRQSAYSPTPLDRPLWVMIAVALIGLLTMANARTERIFDVIFWFILGLAGLVIFLLWAATDHSATKNNLNILWALPTHLFYFYRNKQTEWTEFYFRFVGFIALAVLALWYWLPQELPIPAIPILLLIVIKSLGRRYWKKSSDESMA